MTLLDRAPTTDAVPQPVYGPTESSGVVAVVLDFVGATLPQYDRLLEALRLGAEGPGPVGSLFQWSRSAPDGVRVTEVWQSTYHFERFLREQVEPCLAQLGLPEPEVTTYEVHSYLTEGQVIDSLDGPGTAPGVAWS